MPLALLLLSLFACATAAGQIDSVEAVGTELRSDDLPDIAAADDGTLWLVWMSHDARRDEINLRQYRDGTWSNVLLVPSGDGDVWLPQVALDSQNRVWVVWSARRNGNWDLYARRYDPAAESWGDLVRLTDHRLPDIYPSLAARDGKLAVAWQGFRGSESDILLRTFSEGDWSETVSVSGRPGNDWSPTVALDSRGTAWVTYDSYRNGNYDVYLVGLRDGSTAVAEMAVAETPLFEAWPSVAVDPDDRVWVAWESGGANWGKDNGYNYRYQMPASKTELACGTCFGPGVMLGAERTIHLRAFANGRLQAPARPVQAAFEADAGRYVYRPQVLLDARGNPLVAAKCLLGAGARRRRGWEYRLTRYDGEGWSSPEVVPNSKGRLSTWIRSAVASDGSLWLVWPTDNRREDYLTRPVRFQVYAGKTTSPDPPDRIQLSQPETPSVEVAPGHSDEPGDLAAIRSYRAEIQGRAARIVRGDLHRHTELSWDAGGTIDGSLPEFYRYMLDAASMDFGASTDHQGGAHDYWWWYSQKMTDMYHLPGTYVSLFGYERSVNYPMGHHNVFFADRSGAVVPFYLKRWVPGYLLTDQANRGDQPGVVPPQERDENNDCRSIRGSPPMTRCSYSSKFGAWGAWRSPTPPQPTWARIGVSTIPKRLPSWRSSKATAPATSKTAHRCRLGALHPETLPEAIDRQGLSTMLWPRDIRSGPSRVPTTTRRTTRTRWSTRPPSRGKGSWMLYGAATRTAPPTTSFSTCAWAVTSWEIVSGSPTRSPCGCASAVRER